MNSNNLGEQIHEFACELWPINRSITGEGVRKTLELIKTHIPSLTINHVQTGYKAFDWTVPEEWRIHAAWIIDPQGKKICNFSENNLHVVGYSIPIHKQISLQELQDHLHSLPELPDAIPYVTSYYQDRWGFCISHAERNLLGEGTYEVFIDSTKFDGFLSYGELVLPGDSKEEVFLSTYICHPSMANNELSGPAVTTFLAKWLSSLPRRKFTYRIIFIPETIGSIVYLSKNLEYLKNHVIAGFNITCIGDDRVYSYLPSRAGNTLSDRVAKRALRDFAPEGNFISYGWGARGSDERQYCAPHIDLPIASIMRSKYGEYPEYHTSKDNLVDVVTPSGLEGGFGVLKSAIEIIEKNIYPSAVKLCEPQLGRRGLYPTLSTRNAARSIEIMMNLLTWSDGKKDLIEIAELCNASFGQLYDIAEKLQQSGLLEYFEVPFKHN